MTDWIHLQDIADNSEANVVLVAGVLSHTYTAYILFYICCIYIYTFIMQQCKGMLKFVRMYTKATRS